MFIIKLYPHSQEKKQQADAIYICNSRLQLCIDSVNRQLERTLNGSCLQEKLCKRLELRNKCCSNFIMNTFVNIFSVFIISHL